MTRPTIRFETAPWKQSGLPVGVFKTWRKRPGKRPYLEFQVHTRTKDGHPITKHFYVGVDPDPRRIMQVRAEAIAARMAYELRCLRKGPR